jgi:hypothetical protein
MNETSAAHQNTSKMPLDHQERDFDLYLPAIVSGLNAKGKDFVERTEITTISSSQANFSLKSKVTVGTKLNAVLEIPKTFILEKNLKLRISGNVTFAREDSGDIQKQLICIKLDRGFKIYPEKN